MASKREIWHPPEYTKESIRAVQTITAWANAVPDSKGVIHEQPPTSRDCKIFLDWIIIEASGTYDEPFRPGAQDQVMYMLGRRSIGLGLIKQMKLKPEIFPDD